MERNIKENRTISPNKIILPLSDDENGILDEFIKTDVKDCKETFTCSICICLAWDPVFCPKCDKPFCRSCRLKYGENKICPFKCNSLTFRNITRNEKDYLNKIRIRCTNPDCSEYIQYSSYIDHLEKCKYRKYHCKNEPCKEQGTYDYMISHSKKCEYRNIICSKCKQKFKYCDKKKHERELCPEILVRCRICGTHMKNKIYLKDHKSLNNDNPNCLKIQLENMSKMYKENLIIKDNKIISMENKIKKLEETNKIYENENIKLKKKLEEIKSFITNGYNKFILENNNEKDIPNEINNNEINKKQENKNEKDISNVLKIDDEIEKKNAYNKYLNSEPNKKIENNENQFSNSGSYFYPKKNKYYFRNINNEKKEPDNPKNNSNNSRKYYKLNFRDDKNDDMQNDPNYHMRKIPSLSDLLINKYNDKKILNFKK